METRIKPRKTTTIISTIINAFCMLDTALLEGLDMELSYSYNDKQELIEEFKIVFAKIKAKGIDRLNVKYSKCKLCYPEFKAYSFYNAVTNEFVIRYVIHKESEEFYRIEECKSKPILPTNDDLPF